MMLTYGRALTELQFVSACTERRNGPKEAKATTWQRRAIRGGWGNESS